MDVHTGLEPPPKDGTGGEELSPAANGTSNEESSSAEPLKRLETAVTGAESSNDEENSSNSASSSDSPKVATAVDRKPKSTYQRHGPSLFADSKGNLKFVNLVCRHPAKIFFSILALCVALSVLLVYILFKNGELPFVTGNNYDMSDVRSMAYDSLRLATDEVKALRRTESGMTTEEQEEAEDKDAKKKGSVRPQEEEIAATWWIFESQTDEGVFGSRESVTAMKEAFDLFTKDKTYPSYCQIDYEEDDDKKKKNKTEVESRPECKLPFSPLNMYYASKWDDALVERVLSELSQDYPSNVLRYNFLGVCVEFDVFCPPFTDDEDLNWASALNDNITKIVDGWDGMGTLNDNITQVTLLAAYLSELNTKRGLIDFGFDKNFNLTNPKSMYSRGIVNWGGPLGHTSSITSDSSNVTYIQKYDDVAEDEDQDSLKEHIASHFLPGMKKLSASDYNPEIKSYYFMGSLIREILFDIVKRDASLALFSFIFVCIYIRVSLGSWFLAWVGLLEIGLSIPVSWFVFSILFRIEYFSFLNTLALFIVAAIGADDIFIFMDAYKQSATLPVEEGGAEILESLESRMSWVYRRTGQAMLITSATTCFAFLCTLITPLDSVRAFGIFAALVIFVDYVLVMTLFCTAVVIYHNKFENKFKGPAVSDRGDRFSCFLSWCCCCLVPCMSGGGGYCANTEPSPTALALRNVEMTRGAPTNHDVENFLENGDEGEGKPRPIVQQDGISKFFETKVASLILNPWARLAMAILFLSWLVVASIAAAKFEPTKNSEQFLDEDHPLQKSFSILSNEFDSANDDGLEVYFTWGLGDVDRAGVNRLTKPDFFGTPVFLGDTFELDPECQVEMIQACDDLKSNQDYVPYIKQEDGLGMIKCFMEEFGAFSAVGTLENCEAVENGAWKDTDWTVPAKDLDSFMKNFLEERSCFSDRNTTILNHYADELGWDGKTLRYAGISVQNSILDRFSTKPEPDTRKQYDAMLDISRKLNQKMQKSCGGKVIMTDLDEKFTFMHNQTIYVKSAIISSFVGVGIAFVVLLLSTRLFHIALLASLSIASVLVSVIGCMVMIGWELGSTEGILISVVAGFSVDYVVHLAHSYEAAHGDTATRIRKAFRDMGISVMNGMVTSVGASIPLFFCQLMFFRKFGVFLCLTISFSWVFANFAFMSVLAQLKVPISEKKKLCGI